MSGERAKAGPAILVVDDEASIRTVLESQLTRLGHAVVLAADGEAALEALRRGREFALVISDVKMPRLSGLDLLRVVKSERPDTPFVLLTAHGTIETAVEAMKHGAFDFLTKPFDRDELAALVEKAIRAHEARAREPRPASDEKPFAFGRSERMAELERVVERAADSPSTVLVTGETGVGKELVARALHDRSPRRGGPFVVQNCGALPENLIESELFGHEKGAFTGALSRKPGRIEIANGGTFFLDEVGELALALQTRLLRVLEDGQVLPVGALKPVGVDVRWIAATNRDLKREVESGRFREDLYFRLRVIEIRIPPLRERLGDLSDLVAAIRGRLSKRLGRDVPPLSDEALQLLRSHDFPGNVRELENLIERAAVLSAGPSLGPGDFPDVEPASRDRGESLKGRTKAVQGAVEKREIEDALERHGGNVTRTAEALRLSRRGLQNKMKEYGIRRRPGDQGPEEP